jgi:hypothetical protein
VNHEVQAFLPQRTQRKRKDRKEIFSEQFNQQKFNNSGH